MNPKIHYLLELTKLVGRLGYALSADDTLAFIGILTNIRTLTEKSIEANRPRMRMRISDPIPDYEDEDL